MSAKNTNILYPPNYMQTSASRLGEFEDSGVGMVIVQDTVMHTQCMETMDGYVSYFPGTVR